MNRKKVLENKYAYHIVFSPTNNSKRMPLAIRALDKLSVFFGFYN